MAKPNKAPLADEVETPQELLALIVQANPKASKRKLLKLFQDALMAEPDHRLLNMVLREGASDMLHEIEHSKMH